MKRKNKKIQICKATISRILKIILHLIAISSKMAKLTEGSSRYSHTCRNLCTLECHFLLIKRPTLKFFLRPCREQSIILTLHLTKLAVLSSITKSLSPNLSKLLPNTLRSKPHKFSTAFVQGMTLIPCLHLLCSHH